jgi:predicted DNA-binding protein (UPF0251 family)
MPRPFKCRRIGMRPGVNIFKPAGVPARDLEAVTIGLDELEALRLADLEGLYHEAAAEKMSISRATFGRLLEEARRKLVGALFGSKMLVFEGGPIIMAGMRTFRCDDCGESFEEPFGTGRPAACPHCQSRRFHRENGEAEAGVQHRGRHGQGAGGGGGQRHGGSSGGGGVRRRRRACRARRSDAVARRGQGSRDQEDAQ